MNEIGICNRTLVVSIISRPWPRSGQLPVWAESIRLRGRTYRKSKRKSKSVKIHINTGFSPLGSGWGLNRDRVTPPCVRAQNGLRWTCAWAPTTPGTWFVICSIPGSQTLTVPQGEAESQVPLTAAGDLLRMVQVCAAGCWVVRVL
jgi:hypothetical protein